MRKSKPTMTLTLKLSSTTRFSSFKSLRASTTTKIMEKNSNSRSNNNDNKTNQKRINGETRAEQWKKKLLSKKRREEKKHGATFLLPCSFVNLFFAEPMVAAVLVHPGNRRRHLRKYPLGRNLLKAAHIRRRFLHRKERGKGREAVVRIYECCGIYGFFDAVQIFLPFSRPPPSFFFSFFSSFLSLIPLSPPQTVLTRYSYSSPPLQRSGEKTKNISCLRPNGNTTEP
jgi:hypothetical protein